MIKIIIKEIKSAYKDMNKPLFICTVILFIFGLANILTASSREAVVESGATMTYYFNKQLFVIACSFIIANIIHIIPTKFYYKLAFFAYILFNLLVLYLILFGTPLHGAKNWLIIPGTGFSFQPSEVLKIIVIICLSLMFEKKYRTLKEGETKQKIKVYIYILLCIMIPVALIFLQKDFGTMLVLMIIFLNLFISSPIIIKDKFKIMGYGLCILVVGVLGLYLIRGYVLTNAQKARFQGFFKPCNTYETGGYQVCNCFIAINSGGLFGVGPGKSTQKYSFIPEPHTDSVFAIFAEEYGVFGATVLFMFYISVLKQIINISTNASTIRGRYTALGVASYIFLHIFINLGGIFGIIPLTGIPLPFLSYGGTYALTLMMALAIVQRINIETKRSKLTI